MAESSDKSFVNERSREQDTTPIEVRVEELEADIAEQSAILDGLNQQSAWAQDDSEAYQHEVYYANHALERLRSELLAVILDSQYRDDIRLDDVLSLLKEHTGLTMENPARYQAALESYTPGTRINFTPYGSAPSNKLPGVIDSPATLRLYEGQIGLSYMAEIEIEASGVTDYESFPVIKRSDDTIAVVGISIVSSDA